MRETIIYNVGEIKESVPSSAKIIAVVGSKALDETLYDTSIPDSAEESNSFDKNKKYDFSQVRFATPNKDKKRSRLKSQPFLF